MTNSLHVDSITCGVSVGVTAVFNFSAPANLKKLRAEATYFPPPPLRPFTKNRPRAQHHTQRRLASICTPQHRNTCTHLPITWAVSLSFFLSFSLAIALAIAPFALSSLLPICSAAGLCAGAGAGAGAGAAAVEAREPRPRPRHSLRPRPRRRSRWRLRGSPRSRIPCETESPSKTRRRRWSVKPPPERRLEPKRRPSLRASKPVPTRSVLIRMCRMASATTAASSSTTPTSSPKSRLARTRPAERSCREALSVPIRAVPVPWALAASREVEERTARTQFERVCVHPQPLRSAWTARSP